MSKNCVFPIDLPQFTNKYLDSISFSSTEITKTNTHLHTNTVCRHDMLSIRTIKLFGNLICKPLSIAFNDCLNVGKYPEEWKNANVIPVITKETNSVWKSIGQSLYSLFVVKCLNDSFITKCLPFLLRTIWSLRINEDLELGTLLFTYCLLLPTKFVNLLIRGLKLEEFS